MISTPSYGGYSGASAMNGPFKFHATPQTQTVTQTYGKADPWLQAQGDPWAAAASSLRMQEQKPVVEPENRLFSPADNKDSLGELNNASHIFDTPSRPLMPNVTGMALPEMRPTLF